MTGRDAIRARLYLIGAIVTEVAATLSMKGALEHSWLYAVMVAGYLGAFVLLTLVLRTGMSLGSAYGIWGACGVALTAVLSLLIFDEPLTPLMTGGIVLVICGVLCVELGAQAAHRAPRKEDAA